MHQKNFVICDKETDYARNLMRILAEHRELGYQLHLFQDPEQIKRFAEQHPIQILLISEEFPLEQRRSVKAEETFVLVRDEENRAGSEENAVCKYQSVNQILSKVMELSEKGCDVRQRGGRREGLLIGVYSPIHRIGKTKYAMQIGREFSKRGPVLYLSLEEYSGNGYYFLEHREQNLGDLLYYFRQNTGKFGTELRMVTGQEDGLDYIMPIPVVQDMKAVKGEEWLVLFQHILDQRMYEAVILDLGDGIDGLYQILEKCDTVYTPYIKEPAAMAKLNQYTENLRRTGFESVLEHTVQKQVHSRNGGTVI